jgi:hypothetical protein
VQFAREMGSVLHPIHISSSSERRGNGIARSAVECEGGAIMLSRKQMMEGMMKARHVPSLLRKGKLRQKQGRFFSECRS